MTVGALVFVHTQIFFGIRYIFPKWGDKGHKFTGELFIENHIGVF